MSSVPVDIRVVNSSTQQGIEGALVRVFNTAGTAVAGENTTDATGAASFLLEAGTRYQARAFKWATAIKNPTLFDVVSSGTLLNVFEIGAQPINSPTSHDARLCTCFGYFRTPTGAPAAQLDIQFVARFSPILLDGAGVLTERVCAHTDDNGWVAVPLIRNGEFDVIISGYEDVQRTIIVPDVASCSLPDLVFEVVSRIEGLPSAINLQQGQTVELSPEVFTSVGQRLAGTAKGKVLWQFDNPDPVAVTITWDKLILYGNQPGVTLLTATRAEQSIVRIPDPPLMTGIPIQVF